MCLGIVNSYNINSIMKIFIALSVMVVGSLAQRGFYAGRSPIGYPAIIQTTTSTAAPTGNELGDRFGNEVVSTTTVRLPLEAQGDAQLVNRLSQYPIEHQPFWLINWRALESQRNNPQNYPQKSNHFIDRW